MNLAGAVNGQVVTTYGPEFIICNTHATILTVQEFIEEEWMRTQ